MSTGVYSPEVDALESEPSDHVDVRDKFGY